MNRREFVKCNAGGAMAAAMPNLNRSMAAGNGPERPNIVLIVSRA